MKAKLIPLFLAGFALAAAPAHGAVLAEYLFTGGSAVSTDTELNSTAGNFTMTAPNGGMGFSGTQNNVFAATFGGGMTHGDAAAAVAYGNFFSFTVTPDPGTWFNLTSLTYTSIHNNTSFELGAPDTNATMNFFVRSSVDGFAANVGSTFSQAYNTTTHLRTVNLTGVDFQGVTDPITFRFYVFSDVELSTDQGARWDNVVLNGEVLVIPEPSTALLGGLGLLALLYRRRR